MGERTADQALWGNLHPAKTSHAQSITHTSRSILGMSAILVLAALFPGLSAKAEYAGEGGPGPAGRISRYIFAPDKSKLFQTGGIAGIRRTCVIEGEFDLSVDTDTGAASFVWVDADATDDSPYAHSWDLNDVFNMTDLVGTILEDGSIKFVGTADDGSSARITLTFDDGSAHLTGGTTPPPDSADFFIYSLDAVATRGYGGGTADNAYQVVTAADLIALGEIGEDYDGHLIPVDEIDLDPSLPGGGSTELGEVKTSDKAVIAPNVAPRFAGGFSDNGNAFSHLTIGGEDYLGLFGLSGQGAEVEDPGAKGSMIWDPATTLAGWWGTIVAP